MLLFQKRFHAGLLDGSVTRTFRRWKKPHVKPGGRYRCHPIGVLEVTDVQIVRARDLVEADAKASGFDALADLTAYLATASEEPMDGTTELHRVDLRHGGDGDRVSLALEADLDDAAVQAIAAALARLDAAGAWTRRTLELIGENPRIAASKLAPTFRLETLPFKERVRKLKKLGLTQSFEVGYEVSPRGRAFLERAPAPIKKAAAKKPAPKKPAPKKPAAKKPAPKKPAPKKATARRRSPR